MKLVNLALSISTSILVLPALILNRKTIFCKAAERATDGSVRVAIIGSGVGGSAAAYFSRKLFGDAASIDVYEASSRVGGRLGVMEVDGRMYEAGGSIIHEKNKYMKSFVEELGLKKLKSNEADSLFGIYNGTGFDFMGSKFKILNYLKLLWRYGFDLVTIDKWINNMLKKFGNIYDLQDKGNAYENVDELLNAMGGEEFVGLRQNTTRTVLKNFGLKDITINEIVTSVMRVNYGQDVNLNAFAGSVSLAGVGGGLWSVEGGNYKVCESLLSAANANLHKDTKVSKITKISSKNKPSYTISTSQGMNKSYDIVIVAAPLEVQSNYFSCVSCLNWPEASSVNTFWQTVATFVQGEIDLKHFGFESDSDVPEGIFTTENPKNYFNSIGLQQPVQDRKLTDKDKPVRKIFSRQPLTLEQLQELFPVRNETKSIAWLAYPDLRPAKHFTSFILDEGVFYINAIEHAASAMEMSCVGARNAALLAHSYCKKQHVREEEKWEENTQHIGKGEL